ncbi:MAG: DUF739 family protein [Faecousia sp.]
MEYDYSNLCGDIIKCYGTQAKFADALRISERSLSLKLNNKVGWKQDEMIKACELLDIKLSEIPDYFFVSKVQS